MTATACYFRPAMTLVGLLMGGAGYVLGLYAVLWGRMKPEDVRNEKGSFWLMCDTEYVNSFGIDSYQNPWAIGTNGFRQPVDSQGVTALPGFLCQGG